MQKRLVILLVLVCIALFWVNRSRFIEGFQSPSTPVTAKDAKEILDEYILSFVKEYQTLSQLKSKDSRVENLMKMLTEDINNMNRTYPEDIEGLQTFPYQQFPMIKKEDLVLIKNMLVRTIGDPNASNPIQPATKPQLELFVARTRAFQEFLKNKFALLPTETRNSLQTSYSLMNMIFNESIKYSSEYAKVIGSVDPSKIQILGRMSYIYMIPFSASNFIWDPMLSTKPTGPIQTNNLPIPSSNMTALTSNLQEQTTVAPSGKAPICPSCPPPPKPCPVPPEGKKYSETVRDLLIENALVKAYGGELLLG